MKSLSDMEKTLLSADDLAKTKVCAEAMGYGPYIVHSERRIILSGNGLDGVYDPLHDDAQAMALMKRFHLSHVWRKVHDDYVVWVADSAEGVSTDLNRAIVECVASMHS